LADARIDGGTVRVPFCPEDVVTSLRHERYEAPYLRRRTNQSARAAALQRAYYLLRPFLSVSVRKHLQRFRLNDWKRIPFPSWPVDCTVERVFEGLMRLSLDAHGVDRIPFVWFWPDGHHSCATMTHDVETSRGRDFCEQLMDLDDSHGVKAAFQVVPEERYTVTLKYLESMINRGFEVNIHGLNHRGDLFSDREEFLRQARRINMHGRAYGAKGFRSPVLYRNAAWFDALDFEYDMSVPNVAHLDPQRGGCCSVMPFFIGKLLELPVTTTQDYTLFHILNQYSTEVWERQLAIIGENHGVASFIVHPDYVIESRARRTYTKLLERLSDLRTRARVWLALPGEINRWWRDRSQMTLEKRGSQWEVDGPGKERARVAYATVEGNRVVYRLQAILAPWTADESYSAMFGLVVLTCWLMLAVANVRPVQIRNGAIAQAAQAQSTE
jgi:hypothetical protein